MIAGIFVVAYGTNVITPFLAVYRDRLELGPSATQAIFVVYVAGILTTLLLAGQLSDRYGRKRVLVPFAMLSAVASVVLIFGRDNYALLLTGRLLLGCVSGATFGVGAAWLTELMGPARQVQAAVATTLVTYAGFGVGPPISAAFDRLSDHPLVLPFLLHVGITALVVPLLLTLPDPTFDRIKATPASGSWRPRIELGVPAQSRPAFVRQVVPAGLWVFGFPSVSFALFPVLLAEAAGAGQVLMAGIVGALTAFAGLLSRPAIAKLTPEAAQVAALAGGTAGYVLGIAAFISDFWPLVFPAAVLLGGASGVLTASCLALLARLADETRRGALNSTFYVLAYIGMAMPLLVTTIARITGTTAALAGVATAAAATTVVFATAHRRRGEQVRVLR